MRLMIGMMDMFYKHPALFSTPPSEGTMQNILFLQSITYLQILSKMLVTGLWNAGFILRLNE